MFRSQKGERWGPQTTAPYTFIFVARQISLLSDTLSLILSTTGFGDLIIDLEIHVCRAREISAKVCGVLHCLQVLTLDSDYGKICQGQVGTSIQSSWYWWWGHSCHRLRIICPQPAAFPARIWRWGHSHPWRESLWEQFPSLHTKTVIWIRYKQHKTAFHSFRLSRSIPDEESRHVGQW